MKKEQNQDSKHSFGGGSFYNLLNKDIKELNTVILSLFIIIFLSSIGFISYKITNSYALFSDEITGTKTIEIEPLFKYEKTFNYTGKPEEYTVPSDGYYYIELEGASGGASKAYAGLGAKTSGYIKLKKGEKLYFYVGGKGTTASSNVEYTSGGFNGGGSANHQAGTGGGATDVRLTSGSWDDMSSLISRIMVAGGGGGGAIFNDYVTGGDGGTLYGADGGDLSENFLGGGHGGQQKTSGPIGSGKREADSYQSQYVVLGTKGQLAKGGNGGYNSDYSHGSGAGGGGYYGGSGASGRNGGGAGGSSYISGYAGVNSVKEMTTINHTNQTIHYSGKYFVGGQMIEGQNSGNGYAKITYTHTKPKRKNTKLNNVRYIKDCSTSNSANPGKHWIEIEAIKDGINIAKGKTVTGTFTPQHTNTSNFQILTTGDIDNSNYVATTTSEDNSNQCITVDLENTYDLDEVAVWNYFGDTRVYHNTITSVSSDNTNFTEIVDENVIQTSNGIRANAYIDNINGYSARNKMTMWLDGLANTGTTRNNTTTTWKNLSTNSSGYTATVSGATWTNDSLSFDGTNDYVAFTNKEYTFPMTYSFIYKTNSTDSQIIFGHNLNNAAIGLYQNNKFITSLVSATNMYDAGTITLDKYYKVDVIFRSLTDKTIYVNNKEIPKLSSTEYWSWTESKSYIGKRPSGTYFKGNIKLFQIFSGALTKEEITHNYNYDKQRFNLE